MKNINAVICSLNSKYIHSAPAPWYLLDGIRRHSKGNISCCAVEGTVNEPIENIADRVISRVPDVVGFSCYIWNIASVKKLLPMIKAVLPNCITVFGGPEVSFCAEEFINSQPFCDYVISGEGEYSFAALLNALSGDGLLSDVPGLSRREDGRIVSQPQQVAAAEYDHCRSGYVENLGRRIAYMESSRGCPFSCAFCLSGRLGGVRYFDLDNVFKNIISISQSGSRTVKFVDRTFNSNPRHADAIISFIISEYKNLIPEGVCFHFEIAGDILHRSTIELLKSAPIGLFQLEIGLQSFNKKTLAAVRRNTDTERLCRNIRELISFSNMNIHIDLLAGLPFEDLASFKSSFNKAFALSPNMLQLGFLKLIHGSSMRDRPTEYPCEFELFPPYQVKSTPWLSKADFALLAKAEAALDKFHNSGKFSETVTFLLKHSGKAPFDFFAALGTDRGFTGISLDECAKHLYEFGLSLNVNAAELRDVMVIDRVCTNASGKLPAFLKAYRPDHKRIKNAVRDRLSGINPVLLSASDLAVYADVSRLDPITQRFSPIFVPFPDTNIDNPPKIV